MLEAHQNELDLVIVSKPDHTHFAATYAAMELGIAVHTQKPLTHNIWQARTLQAAAKKFKVQTVMGNQGHNYEGMRLMKDWADSGICGDILEIYAWTGRTTKNNANAKLEYPEQPVPEKLDWDFYDLENDPKELHNAYKDPKFRNIIMEMIDDLIKKREALGDTDKEDSEILEIISNYWNS